MDKKQAQQQIRDVFQNGFQRETYQHFIRNLLNQVEARDGHYSGNLIPEAFKEHITQYWRIGKYIDPDGTELDLLVVEVKSLAKLDRARTSLRNFAVNRLKKFDKACSLIAFYAKEDGGDDWRFSFVKIEHGAFQDDKGKVKLKTELTPAKRYSYLVGVHENSHTAQDQLLDLLVMDYANPKIDDIEKAFSIEKVTAEFFEQYKGLYFKLSEQLTGQPFFQKGSDTEKAQAVARFAKKLLGQIVFLYFLQKKGWLGADKGQAWSTGPRKFMRQCFNKTVAASGNYYHDFLQYLFYEALADDRKGQLDPDYYQRFTCKIPFLNGGLFEAEYDWQSQSIALPDSIFHNDDKNKAGDEGTGILDVFDRYNFTIKEDEPLEKEVAVDPEMLGKVFENMLEGAERKSKGAFYTPREIVHYMCQESLIHYLDTSVNSSIEKSGQPNLFAIMQGNAARVSKEDIEILIRRGHLFVENDETALHAQERIESGEQKTTKHKVELPESVKANARLIDNKLAKIKVCDPAIGSGAFPVGLLHEIVTTRLALAPHSGNQWSAYDLKRHTIRESLYGVDIDPSAIDIARLRLSLIVDEEDFSSIEALPNLDYKIMQGNSLVEEYWGVKLFNEEFIQEDDWNEAKIRSLQERQRAIDAEGLALYRDNQLTADKEKQLGKEIKGIVKSIKALRAPKDKTPPRGLFDIVTEAKRKAGQLEQLHKDFFSACSPERKKEIRDQITTLEWELIEATLAEQNQLDSLAKLQQIKQSGEKPFFLWKLNFPEVFKEKGGFDVVIGNPPYVRADRSEEHTALRKAILSSNQYETLWEKWDLYIPFIEKGYKLLREGGVTTMIVSDAYCHAKYAQKSQEWFLKNSRVLRLDFFSKIQLFDAGVRNITYFFQKAAGSRNRPERCLHAPAFGNVTFLSTDEQRELDCRAFFPEDNTSATTTIINSESLSNIFYISYGLRPSSDESGFENKFITADLITETKDEIHTRPYVDGKHLSRWLPKTNLWIEWGTERAPAMFYRPTFEELYTVSEKILAQRSPGPNPKACYDNKQLIYTPSSVGFIPWHALAGVRNRSIQKTARYRDEKSSKSGPRREDLEAVSERFSAKYVLAVMNSSMTRDILRQHRRSNIHLYPDDWKQLPIPNIPKESQKPFHVLVDYILTLVARISLKLQYAYFEQLIDGLVYELYFAAEIKDANKEILKHLGDLTAITDAMSDEEKLAIIQTEFDRLYDPRHPVRNHLETLDSVEEVRIIREALKR